MYSFLKCTYSIFIRKQLLFELDKFCALCLQRHLKRVDIDNWNLIQTWIWKGLHLSSLIFKRNNYKRNNYKRNNYKRNNYKQIKLKKIVYLHNYSTFTYIFSISFAPFENWQAATGSNTNYVCGHFVIYTRNI